MAQSRAYVKHGRGQQYNWLNKVLVFDIETVENSAMVNEHMPEFKAPGNYKDPVKIAAAIENKENNFRAKTPLDLDFAKVDSIALGVGNQDVMSLMVGDVLTPTHPLYMEKFVNPLTESDLLTLFWLLAKKAGKLAGYNITGFDLPIIQRRSWVLDVDPSRPLYNLKPWDPLLLDIMKVLYHNGYGPGVKYRGLKQVCKMYKIPNPFPDLDGSQYDELDRKERRKYVVNDVVMTRELIKRTHGHYWS